MGRRICRIEGQGPRGRLAGQPVAFVVGPQSLSRLAPVHTSQAGPGRGVVRIDGTGGFLIPLPADVTGDATLTDSEGNVESPTYTLDPRFSTSTEQLLIDVEQRCSRSYPLMPL